MGGWDDVGKGPIGQEGGGRFFAIPDIKDGVLTLRFLEEEPFNVWQHRISQVVGGEEKFASVNGVARWEDGELVLVLDDDYVQNNSKRWPLQPIHHLRAIQIDEGEPVGDVGILAGGKQIFEVIKQVFEKKGSITRFDFDLSKTGKGRMTKYTVGLAAEHADISDAEWEGLIEELSSDPAIQWENVFQIPQTGEQQRRMFELQGFDIDYDPAAELAEEMDPDEAYNVRMPTTGGKYPGKSMRELVVIDLGYLTWVAANYTSDDRVAAAARVVIRALEDSPKIQGGSKRALKKGEGAKPSAGQRERARRRAVEEEPEEDEDEEDPIPITRGRKGKPAPPEGDDADEEEPGADDADEGEEPAPPRRGTKTKAAATVARGPLVVEINELIGAIPKYEETSEVSKVIKKHGGGKTRLRDLDVGQLEALRDALEQEKSAEAKPATRRKK